MTFLDAILLGILQGATEFLPVSSSGHLALAQHLLGDFEQSGVLFDVLLHVGSMVAVAIYFWRDLTGLISSLWRRDETAAQQRFMVWLLIAGSIPTAVIGLLFKDFFIGLFERPVIVCIMLLVTGGLLWLAERLRNRESSRKEMSFIDAIVVGTVQGCAIIPGISRSGSTIAALLLRGVDGETAARFSFLLALPAVFGAALLSLKDLDSVTTGTIFPYIAGTAAALVTGLLCIHLLMGVIRRRRLHWFAFYCWFVGGLGLIFLL
ncbi:MAG: undecaprenyl-diphosphatase UppP [Desulfuromonadales bacterium]|nr:undecaprenyl-diphosphatase UppP [Desulfuromonadales bacterium]